MKFTIKYEAVDLKQIIRMDLARQGITATDADITLPEGVAVIDIEVVRDDAEVGAAPVVAAPPPPPAGQHRADPPAPTPPPLKVVEGGAQPVDMSDVLGASLRTARSNPGMYPVPERQLMQGESFEYPGEKE